MGDIQHKAKGNTMNTIFAVAIFAIIYEAFTGPEW